MTWLVKPQEPNKLERGVNLARAILITKVKTLVDQIIKQALIGYDSSGKATSITIDGKRYTNFPANTYDSGLSDVKNSTIVVQIEIPTGLAQPTTLPNYTVFHHATGKRIAITGHS